MTTKNLEDVETALLAFSLLRSNFDQQLNQVIGAKMGSFFIFSFNIIALSFLHMNVKKFTYDLTYRRNPN